MLPLLLFTNGIDNGDGLMHDEPSVVLDWLQ